MIWAILAFLLERIELLITLPHFNNRYAGWGAINGTNNRTIQAPMRYRVLVPWVLAVLEKVWRPAKNERLLVYEVIRWAAVWYALWAISLSFGEGAAIMTAALLPVTFFFDYWNWPFELGGIALAMTGNIYLTAVGLMLWALSKETAPLAGVAYALVTGDVVVCLLLILGALFVLIVVRWIQGDADFYCDRVMLKRNWEMLMKWRKSNPVIWGDPIMAVVITALGLMSILTLPTGWPVVVLILAAGWTLALAHETRIFVVVLPWVAQWLLTL